MKLSYYHPLKEIEKHGGKLPHWQQGQVPIFITWRLADALPLSCLEKLKFEEQQWIKRHPKPWDSQTQEFYYRNFVMKIEKWLDCGFGSCVLRRPDIRSVVEGALHFGDPNKYSLLSYVIMPNHVHLMLVPDQAARLGEMMFSIKSYSSSRINNLLGVKGPLWQEKYWDRLIRSPAHGRRVLNYIRRNPEKAKLRDGAYTMWEREDVERLFELK